MTPTADECAQALLHVIPGVMQVIRSEVRRQRGRNLSILQLRALIYLSNHPGATLSAVAEHVGVTLPSMSTQVTKLVHSQLVQRSEAVRDRRFVTLQLTAQGQATLETAMQSAQRNLAAHCERLTPRERTIILQALEILRGHFVTHPTPELER
jgi:DNA-binding MarR family transcriptional regulator